MAASFQIEDREPNIGVAIGKRGVGKTYTTLCKIQDYMRGNPATGKIPRKVLILDINDEFGDVQRDHKNPKFKHVKILPLSKVSEYSRHPLIECRRIRVIHENGKVMSLNEIAKALDYIMEYFSGGLLLIEDPTKFISDSLPGDLLGKICTLRHRNCDVMMHFQYYGKLAHPKIWGSVNYVRSHKVGDSVEKYKKAFDEHESAMKIIESLVNDRFIDNKRFYAFYNKDIEIKSGTKMVLEKIQGQFTKQQFVQAIKKYLERDYNTIVKPEINRVNLDTGRPIYQSHKQAVQSLINNFISQYYGNPF